MTNYMGAIQSDLSRFHGIRDMENMPSAEFFLLTEYLGAYDGALTALVRRDQEEEEARRPLPPAARNHPTGVKEVSAEEIQATVMDGREF